MIYFAKRLFLTFFVKKQTVLLRDLLRKSREDRGLTLKEVASVLGLDQAILSKMERGERNFKSHHIEALCKIYSLDFSKKNKEYIAEKIAELINGDFEIEELLILIRKKQNLLKRLL